MSEATFGKFKKTKTENPPSKFDKRVSEYLYRELKDKKLLSPRTKKFTWPSEVQKLRVIDKIPRRRIKKALQWVCENLKKPYCPLPRSARSFRSKFLQIEEAMHRESIIGPSTLDNIEVSEQARELEKEMGELIWPDKNHRDCPELKKVELKVIEASLQTHGRFIRKLRKLKTKFKNENNQYLLHAVEILLEQECDNHFSVYWWMLDTHQMAWEWDEWNGKLENCVFNYNSKRFTRQITEMFMYGFGQLEPWEQVKEHLNNADQT